MVTIRLARFGRKKRAFYRVVAVDSNKKVSGANLEILGYWDPTKDNFKIDQEKLDKWVKTGAQISTAVKGLISPENKPAKKSKKKSKDEVKSEEVENVA